jgi:hypothetical protein
MNNLFNLTAINQELITYLAIDLVIAIALLSMMRFVSGLTANVSTKEQLAEHDNFAFGISLAGSILALGIVLTGAITGESAHSYFWEIIGMTSYGLLGLVLIKVGRIIHDRFALHKLNKTEQIIKGNITIGIVDAAGAIATAIIVRAVLIWVEGIDLFTFIAIISGFIVSQAILVFVTRIREYHYARHNQNDSMQEAFTNGQLALAIRYSGQLISTALAVTAGSYFLHYSPESLLSSLIFWLLFGLAMTVLMWLLTTIAKKIILFGINLVEEVDQQHNIGVACVEMAISISIALLLTSLMA